MAAAVEERAATEELWGGGFAGGEGGRQRRWAQRG